MYLIFWQKVINERRLTVLAKISSVSDQPELVLFRRAQTHRGIHLRLQMSQREVLFIEELLSSRHRLPVHEIDCLQEVI